MDRTPIEVLLDDEGVIVERYEPEQVIWVRRRPVGDAIEAFERAMGLAYERPELRGYGIVLDVRAAIGRSSDEFERQSRRLRDGALQFFDRFVVLVATAVGTLQVQRIRGDDGGTTTRDAEEAMTLASPRS